MASTTNVVSTAATALMVVCAVVLTGLVIRREVGGSRHVGGGPEKIADWQGLTLVGPILGPSAAPISVVEFSDFECPSCAALQPVLQAAWRTNPTRFRVVYRHLPLSRLHPHAVATAEASECAREQDAFEAFHDTVFTKQHLLGVESLVSLARTSGITDTAAFGECLRERRYSFRVRRDIDEAFRLGIRATPTLIVKGRVFSGVPTLRQFEDLLRE